jgi:hypothetical protein
MRRNPYWPLASSNQVGFGHEILRRGWQAENQMVQKTRNELVEPGNPCAVTDRHFVGT